ncbi:MAG TPA: hypothetical protein VF755_29855 [Catenuloplanes sp.]|jgi:hypothetical protein
MLDGEQRDFSQHDTHQEPAAPAGPPSSRTRGRRRVWLTAALSVLVLALIGGGVGWAYRDGAAAPPAAEAGTPAAKHFGPIAFGGLRPGMATAAALATGELATAPISAATGCEAYSFTGGPAPDPAAMAADAKLEKEYAAATKAADKASAKADKPLRRNASAQESADHAQLSADSAGASAKAIELAAKSTQRAVERGQAMARSGAVTFGEGRLRMIVAPPGARTAEGIGRDSTVEQLKAAYDARGLKAESEGRYELAAPDQPNVVMAFNVEAGKVSSLLLLDPTIKCD